MSESEEVLDQELEVAGTSHSEGLMVDIFRGRFSVDKILPWPEQVDESETEIRRTILLLKKVIMPQVDIEEIERRSHVPDHVVGLFASYGFFAMKCPIVQGGRGLSQKGYTEVLGFVGSYSSALAALLSAHNSLGVLYPLLHHGTEDQKKKFLGYIQMWPTGFCFTERGVGSDPASMKTYALRVRSSSGEVIGYRITGEKWYTTNALKAKYLAVIAVVVDDLEELKVAKKKNFGVFIVDTSYGGVEIGSPNEFAGMRGIDNANPVFKNVLVPVENLIGGEGDGFNIALKALNSGRIAVAAISAASAKQALNISRTWAKNRIQWEGRPIGEKEQIGSMLMRMATEILAMESLSTYAALLMDRGKDSRVEAAASKVFCSERAWALVDDMLQIRGGRGYESSESLRRRENWAPPVERIWRDLRVSRILEGSSQILSLWVCLAGFDFYLKMLEPILDNHSSFIARAKALIGFLGYYLRLFFGSRQNERSLGLIPMPLRKHSEFIEKYSRKLAREIMFSMMRYQKKMKYKQMLVSRFFSIAANLTTIATVCGYVSDKRESPEYIRLLKIADIYCRMARRRIRELFRELSDNEDMNIRDMARRIMNGDYKYLEENVLTF